MHESLHAFESLSNQLARLSAAGNNLETLAPQSSAEQISIGPRS